jgi:hypothetical protein
MAAKYVVRKEDGKWVARKRANWFNRRFRNAEWDMDTIWPWQFDTWEDAFEDAFWWCHHQREGWTSVPPMHFGEPYKRADYQMP